MKKLKKLCFAGFMMISVFTLSGCGSEKQPEEEIDAYTYFEWIDKAVDEFGFMGYLSDEPYTYVSKNDVHFENVQTAFEVGLISWHRIKEFDGDQKITKAIVAESLLDITDLNVETTSNLNDIIPFALEKGIVDFSYTGSKDNDDIVSKEVADKCLKLAKDYANNKTFDSDKNWYDPDTGSLHAEGSTDVNLSEVPIYDADGNLISE